MQNYDERVKDFARRLREKIQYYEDHKSKLIAIAEDARRLRANALDELHHDVFGPYQAMVVKPTLELLESTVAEPFDHAAQLLQREVDKIHEHLQGYLNQVDAHLRRAE